MSYTRAADPWRIVIEETDSIPNAFPFGSRTDRHLMDPPTRDNVERDALESPV